MPNATNSGVDLLFSDEAPAVSSDKPKPSKPPFRILIVDDEKEVHHLTKMVLRDYVFEERAVSFLDAFTGKEAKDILKNEKDIALILLDVVMESDDAGLNLVKYIREVLKNSFTRIILRTGQPGQAPEREVIINYDINDYKEKAELTSGKLFTTVTTALRSYRDLIAIDESRKGLRSVIDATASLFEPTSLSKLAQGILQQLHILFHVYDNSSLIHASSFAAVHSPKSSYSVISATGEFMSAVDQDLEKTVSKEVYKQLMQAEKERKCLISGNRFIGFFETSNHTKNLVYVEGLDAVNQLDRDIIKLFSNNVAIAFENLFLNEEIIDTQKSIVYMLGEVVEKRSHETGNHVRRMTELSCIVGEALGLGDKDLALLRLGAPMHDIGKIAITDSILHKPGKLTDEEYEIMKTHTTEGYAILKGSDREAMHTAAIIAHQHHEKWNGTGYPQGLSGDSIHLFAQISGLADVVDALGHKRCYKEAWTLEEILKHLEQERDQHFSGTVIDAFLSRLDQYKIIQQKYA